jgi:hypothetical protein
LSKARYAHVEGVSREPLGRFALSPPVEEAGPELIVRHGPYQRRPFADGAVSG